MADFMFQSSGNEEQDEAHREDIIRTESRLEDNVCPNGCATMVLNNPYEKECPVCHFVYNSNVPFK